MGTTEIPWVITIKENCNIAELSKKQKLYYTLNVVNVSKRSSIESEQNKRICVIPLFKSNKSAKFYNINKWNSINSVCYIYDAFKESRSHCLYLKKKIPTSLYSKTIDDDILEYIEFDNNVDISSFVLMNNLYFYYISDITELNNVLSLNGVLLNPLADIEQYYDKKMVNNFILEYFEHMLKL